MTFKAKVSITLGLRLLRFGHINIVCNIIILGLMPFKRKFRKYGKRRSGRPWYKRKYSAMQIASKALSAARYLRKLINVEYKYHDVQYTTAPSNTAVVQLLSSIAGGSDVNTRGGNSVKAVSLTMRGDCTMNASATVTAIRYIVFIWNDNTSPINTDILDADTTVSNRNMEKTDKIRVLIDKVIYLDNYSKRAMQIRPKVFKLGHHMRWSSSTNTAVESGSIWIYVVCNEGTNTPTNTLNFRLRFIDN
ncbi:capsid protein [Circoviridae sp.]|nr:capsid protein [Circoviridae sp.]